MAMKKLMIKINHQKKNKNFPYLTLKKFQKIKKKEI